MPPISVEGEKLKVYLTYAGAGWYDRLAAAGGGRYGLRGEKVLDKFWRNGLRCALKITGLQGILSWIEHNFT